MIAIPRRDYGVDCNKNYIIYTVEPLSPALDWSNTPVDATIILSVWII